MTRARVQVFRAQSVALGKKGMFPAIMLLAAILRLIGANSEFWFDEIVTVQNYVRLPAQEIIRRYDAANNHVLNSLLSHVVTLALGEQPWAVRLPAILFGVATVWAFSFVAHRLWSHPIAVLGTLMFAVSYPHVYYTQNARGYSAFLFFALVSMGLLDRLVSADGARHSRWYGMCYAVAIALGAYSLPLMAFVALGHGCALLLARRWRALAWLLSGAAITLLIYAPMARDLLVYFSQRASETGNPLFSAAFAQELEPILPMLVIAAIITPVLLARLGRRRPLAAMLLFLPLAFNIVIPAWRGQGAHPRSLLYALPVAYMLLMEAMYWIGPRVRWAPWATTSAVTLASLLLLSRYYPLPKQGFQQALVYIAAHRGPNDDQIGLTLGGKAARFYDPSFVLIEDAEQLRQWLVNADAPTWVIFTFEADLQRTAPSLHDWLLASTIPQARFAGVIGDGTVQVRLWLPHALPLRPGASRHAGGDSDV